MKRIIIIALSIIVAAGVLFYFKFYNSCCEEGSCVNHNKPENAFEVISVTGSFKGKSLYVQNPFDTNNIKFCIKKITVNNKEVREIQATAFEIDFAEYGIKEGDKVDVKIMHSGGCKPIVLNAQVIDETLAKKDSLMSVITCPKCGHKKSEPMPTAVCQIKYTCENCKIVMTPKEGDCCVFCTHGDKKCPSMQEG